MIVRLGFALPCAHATGSSERCGTPTTLGFIAPTDGDGWDLLTVCAIHLDELAKHADQPVAQLTPREARVQLAQADT